MSEQLTLIEEAFGLTVVEGENLQLTLDGGNGPSGPNTVTTATGTNLTGYIYGNGTNIAGATAAATASDPSTLVLRDSSGAGTFGGLSTNGQVEFNGVDAGDSLTFNMVNYVYGANAAAAHRTALGLGTTDAPTFAGATFSSGTITTSQPLALTQTWSTTATYKAIDVNITDSGPSNAASLLMDLRVGGVNRFQINKNGGVKFNLSSSSGGNPQIELSSSSKIYTSTPNTWIGGQGVLGSLDNTFTIGPAQDIIFTRDAANTLAQRNGTGLQPQAFRLYNTYTSATSFERLNFRWDTNVAKIGTEKGSAGGVARDLVLETDGTERVRVLATGNVGIGTTSPAAKLDVVGNMALTGPSYPVLDVARNTGATNDFRATARFSRTNSGGTSSAGIGVGVYFELPNSSNVSKFAGFFGGALSTVTSGSEVGELVFSPAWIGSDPSSRRDMVLRSAGAGSANLTITGNIGIGTTSPASRLTVTNGDAEITDSASGVILKSPDGTRYRVTVANGGALTTTAL